MASLISQATQVGYVRLNQVAFVQFPAQIGIIGLVASTVVAIIGPDAAIVAQIAPDIEGNTLPHSFILNGQRRMRDVLYFYYQNSEKFPPASTRTFVVVAGQLGNVTTPEHVFAIHDHLNYAGIPTSSSSLVSTYNPPSMEEIAVPGTSRGTFFIDASRM